MKKYIFLPILLIILFENVFSQKTDTIFVYDTIVEYNTITIHDTIFETEYFSNNTDTIQSAILSIDTSKSNVDLIIYDKNNTATIPINSIIVKDINSKSDTMKNMKLLGMMLLAAQNVTNAQIDTNAIKPINSNVIDTLKGRTTITTNAMEGLKVVDIIERIYSLRKKDRKS